MYGGRLSASMSSLLEPDFMVLSSPLFPRSLNCPSNRVAWLELMCKFDVGEPVDGSEDARASNGGLLKPNGMAGEND